jgi:ribosome-binding protein aMBF1 (putative translation factor)
MSINANLTPEQMAELEEIRAALSTPEARAEQEAIRVAIEAEIPPMATDPETAAALARLRVARERLGLSLDDLSKRTGIDGTMLARLESGKMNPTLVMLNHVARALGLRLEWDLVAAASEAVGSR